MKYESLMNYNISCEKISISNWWNKYVSSDHISIAVRLSLQIMYFREEDNYKVKIWDISKCFILFSLNLKSIFLNYLNYKDIFLK